MLPTAQGLSPAGTPDSPALSTQRTDGESAAAAPQTHPTIRHSDFGKGLQNLSRGTGMVGRLLAMGPLGGNTAQGLEGAPFSKQRNIPALRELALQGGDLGLTWGRRSGPPPETPLGSSTTPPSREGQG